MGLFLAMTSQMRLGWLSTVQTLVENPVRGVSIIIQIASKNNVVSPVDRCYTFSKDKFLHF